MATREGAQIIALLTKRGWKTVEADPKTDLFDQTYGDPDLIDQSDPPVRCRPAAALVIQRRRDRACINALADRLADRYQKAISVRREWHTCFGHMKTPRRPSEAENRVIDQMSAAEADWEKIQEQLPEFLAAVIDHNKWFAEVLDVVKHSHTQRADDLCWMDIDKIFAACGLSVPDRQVGDKKAMLKNCERFVTEMCEDKVPWRSYADLEAENARMREALAICGEGLRAIAVNASSAFADDSHRGPAPFVSLINSKAHELRGLVEQTLAGTFRQQMQQKAADTAAEQVERDLLERQIGAGAMKPATESPFDTAGLGALLEQVKPIRYRYQPDAVSAPPPQANYVNPDPPQPRKPILCEYCKGHAHFVIVWPNRSALVPGTSKPTPWCGSCNLMAHARKFVPDHPPVRTGVDYTIHPLRTVSDVKKLRTEFAVQGGCCDRFADNQGCDCMKFALPD